MSGYKTPLLNDFCGEPLKRRVRDYYSTPAIEIEEFETAYKGSPEENTSSHHTTKKIVAGVSPATMLKRSTMKSIYVVGKGLIVAGNKITIDGKEHVTVENSDNLIVTDDCIKIGNKTVVLKAGVLR